MKITQVETYKCWGSWCNWLFVKINTDEGLYGWGEGSLPGAIEAVERAIHELSHSLIGMDPLGPARHWQAMYNAWRWRGGSINMTALSALDIALWDLEGKRLNVPIYRLLGGPYRERLTVYASHWLTGVKTPEEAYNGAQEAVRRGFTGFKWIPFTRQALHDNENKALASATELMAAAREGAGDETNIFVECAERLSSRTMIKVAELFRPYNPAWFEEPIPFENAKVMAELQQAISFPIATGERLLSRWEYRELLENGGCRVIQPDLMHAGGFTEVFKIAAMADTYYVPVAPHNPGGPICNLAAMHLAAAIPNFYVLEQMENERTLRDEMSTEAVKYQDGQFILPDGPGLGTDLRIDLIKERPYKPQPMALTFDTLWR